MFAQNLCLYMRACVCVCVCVSLYMHSACVFWSNINTYIINERPPGLVCKMHMPKSPTHPPPIPPLPSPRYYSRSHSHCWYPFLLLRLPSLSTAAIANTTQTLLPPSLSTIALLQIIVCVCLCVCIYLFMCVLWLTASVTCQCSMLSQLATGRSTMSTVQRFKSTSTLLYNTLPPLPCRPMSLLLSP